MLNGPHIAFPSRLGYITDTKSQAPMVIERDGTYILCK